MISVEDKIDIFDQELNDQLASYKKKTLTEIQEACKEREERADREIKKQNQAIKDRFARLENRNVSKIISEGRSQARDLILTAKKDIRADFLETVLDRISEITENKSYKKHFIQNLKEVREVLSEPQAITFYINSDEYNRFKTNIAEVFDGFNITFQDLPERNIGGFMIHDQDGRISYDYTLESLVNENILQAETILNNILYNNGEIK